MTDKTTVIRLHLGCWERYHPYFTHHVDIAKFPHVNIRHDVRTLPMFRDGSVDLIYASHVLEYFDRHEVENVLREWNRVMKKGAVLRIAVPDFDELCNAYKEFGYGLKDIVGPMYGRMEIGKGKVIYHKSIWNFVLLKQVLTECGFNHVCLYDWRKTEHADMDDWSQSYLPHMDKENGLLISLNMEAEKL